MNQPTKYEQPSPRRDRVSVVRFELAPKTMITLVLVIAGVWLLIRLLPVLLVLVVALLVFDMMSPAVRWLETRRVGRGLAIAIVFTTLSVAALLIAALTIPSLVEQASALLQQEPALRSHLADRLAGFPPSAQLASWLRNYKYNSPASGVGAWAFAYSLRVSVVVAGGTSAIFLALYMMIERDQLRGWIFAVVPRSHHIRLSRIMMNLETIVGAYVRGQALTCLIMAGFTFILLTACGVKNALMLALIAGAADILPYIGVFLAVAPAVLAALPRGPAVTVIVLLAMLAYQVFESRFVVPRVYGKALRLPSAVVLFSLLAGWTLMGILGALLALPVAAAIMMLLEELRVQLPGEQEQEADADLREGDDRAEQAYLRRTEGASTEQAAAIAVEISDDRLKEERKKDD
jgi:putative heme transporter